MLNWNKSAFFCKLAVTHQQQQEVEKVRTNQSVSSVVAHSYRAKQVTVGIYTTLPDTCTNMRSVSDQIKR